MATVIDSLLVTLGLDAKGMTKGAADAGAALKKMTRDAEDAATDFKRQQEESAAAFQDKVRKDLSQGKITDTAAKKQLNEFKKQQQDEQTTFKRNQKDQLETKKKGFEASQKQQKESKETLKKATEGFSSMRNEIMGIAAALLGVASIKAFGEDLIKTGAATSRMSDTLGIGVDELTAWRYAAEQAGLAAGDMDDMMRHANDTQMSLSGGTDPQKALQENQAFSQAMIAGGARGNLNPTKLNDRNLSSQERIAELAHEVVGMEEKKAVLALKAAGYSEAQARYMYEQGDALLANVEAIKKLNPNAEAAGKISLRLSKVWVEMKQRIEGVGNTILVVIGPALETVLGWLNNISKWFAHHPRVAAAAFATVAAAIGTVTAALAVMTAVSFVGMIGKVTGLATLFTGVAGALGAIALTIGAIAAAAISAGTAIGSIYRFAKGEDAGNWINDIFNSVTGGGFNGSGVDPNAHTPEELAKLDAARKAHGSGVDPNAHTPEELAKLDAARKAHGSGVDRHSTSDPRGIRNNNPGNLNYVGQAGATKETGPDGRFAVFQTMDEGIKALAAQLKLYGKRGMDTVQTIISKYAPAGENNTAAYIASVSKKLGVGAGEHLDLNNKEVLKQLIAGISQVEVGAGKVTTAQIDRALGTGAQAAVINNQANNANSQTANSSQIETHLHGDINVNAPNAKTNGDIANATGDKIGNYLYGTIANYGLS